MTVGRKRLRAKQSAGALRALRVLARLDPAYRGLPQTLGKALEAEALRAHFEFRPDAALSLYLEALEVDPSLFKPYVGAAELLITAKKKKRALDLLTQAQRHHPGNTQIQAMTLEAMGLYKGRRKGRRGGPARRR
jgi:tetratricopeptide (TPR) repeat protein